MVVIKSCENDVATGSRLSVSSEHHSEVSSDVIMSISQQNPVGSEAKEPLGQLRVSPRLRNQPRVHYDEGLSCVTSLNPNVRKKAKLNPFKQHGALIKEGKSNMRGTCSHRDGCGVTCEACRDAADSTSDGFVFDEMDIQAILRFRNTFRSRNECLKPDQIYGYWIEDHVAGPTVSKYLFQQLRRVATVLAVNKVLFPPAELPSDRSYPWLVCKDLSNGQEKIPIPVLNDIDDPPVGPTGFTYITSMQFASNVKLLPGATGCQCEGSCANYSTCSCAHRNFHDFPYIRQDGGRLIRARDIVYECGPSCGCRRNCGNKISQMGLKYRLEVYRTPNKGWAVRTWDFVPSGAPICEYLGVLSKIADLDNVTVNEYLFHIDVWQTIKEGRSRDESFPLSNFVEESDDSTPEFCIDGGSFGNVSRFINHSCNPNLFIQSVMSPHLNIRQARLVLFAAKNIEPYEELTYDYGYQLDSVAGPDGKIKQLPCYCGGADCRKRLY